MYHSGSLCVADLPFNSRENLDGCPHITISTSIILPQGLLKDKLYGKIREAWVALRQQVPGMANRGFRFDDGLKQYAMRYEIPRTKDDIEKWVAETVIIDDDAKTLLDSHYSLRHENWWTVSANKYAVQLHVSPTANEDEWLFRSVGFYVTYQSLFDNLRALTV